MTALGQLEQDRNLPKTYLLEFHPNGGAGESEWLPVLRSSLLAWAGPDVQTADTDDPTLLLMEITSRPREKVEFAVDALDPRFLLFHTLDGATEADRAVDALVQREPAFDRAWFHADFLMLLMSSRFAVEGWRAWFQDAGPVSADSGHSRLPPKLVVEENGDYGGGYPAFSRSPYARKTALETLFLLNATGDGDFARARIKRNGRLTARGNDFLAFLNIVTEVQERYARVVRSIESKYRLCPVGRAHGVGLEGRAVSIELARPVPDVEQFSTHIFGGSEPFRLLGLGCELAPGLYRARALDLHVVEPLTIEISHEFVRLYLPERTCGNTIVRFVSLLQHHFDACTRMVDDAA